MSRLATGWEVICPDGRVRHYPYLSREHAEAEAGRLDHACGNTRARPTALETSQPPCPGGRHVARPAELLARAAARVA